MKRVGERKSLGEARPEERGPVPPSPQSGVSSRGPTKHQGLPALQLCFLQGSVLGCSGASLWHLEILPP